MTDTTPVLISAAGSATVIDCRADWYRVDWAVWPFCPLVKVDCSWLVRFRPSAKGLDVALRVNSTATCLPASLAVGVLLAPISKLMLLVADVVETVTLSGSISLGTLTTL
ncbi:hypothetical protein GLUCOINTEAF2_0202896 [Komagataeibacter intermedius AF2]|uniref:Uncharacterized protein n=1 Tax=Komagataeibacter intermedius AF2 TaxID=1458464 RepID=A0A0N0ME99_9PROT|nr:hypothetical protein GLUCOINTEAF2_0202896 [Komagataeibacter intermedius AF2]